MNKAHIKFLEFKIYEAATQAQRYSLQNGNVPTCPVISEPEQAVILEFFENLKLLVGTLGYKVFEPLTRVSINETEEYFLSGPRGAKAKAIVTNEGFVVIAGSEVSPTHVPSASDVWIRLRNELQEQVIVVRKEDRLVFSKDHLFSSPTAAAAVVLGRNANGRTEWKDKNGKTLKENEAQ